MKEAHLQGAVIDMCRLFGVAWYHAYSSRRSVLGWPDLALCGSRGFMLRELKTAAGRLTAEQQQWGLMLCAAGVSWDVLASGRPAIGADTARARRHPLTSRRDQECPGFASMTSSPSTAR